MTNAARLVLLTGATGYVGSRLLNQLESFRVPVRCLARRPEYLHGRVASNTDVIGGDVLNPTSLTVALDGVDTAYYLVHSMGSAGSFEEEDRRAHETSPRRPGKQRSDGSSTWEGWATRQRRSRPTCGVATKLVPFSEAADCRSSSFAPQSYWAPAASLSR